MTLKQQTHTLIPQLFMWSAAVVALGLSAWSLVECLYGYAYQLNSTNSQIYYYDTGYAVSQHVALAILFVTTPLALSLFYILSLRAKKLKEWGESWVRTLGLWLLLYGASVFAVVASVKLFAAILVGELQTDVIYVSPVVIVLSLIAAAYFYASLAGFWSSRSVLCWLIPIFYGALSLAVAAAGLAIYGLPHEIRDRVYDDERLSDLQSIQYAVDNYYYSSGKLPTSLASLIDEYSSIDQTGIEDPQTQMPYTYRATSDNAYTVCATFAYSTNNPRFGWRVWADSWGEEWLHDAGEYCFEREVY